MVKPSNLLNFLLFASYIPGNVTFSNRCSLCWVMGYAFFILVNELAFSPELHQNYQESPYTWLKPHRRGKVKRTPLCRVGCFELYLLYSTFSISEVKICFSLFSNCCFRCEGWNHSGKPHAAIFSWRKGCWKKGRVIKV